MAHGLAVMLRAALPVLLATLVAQARLGEKQVPDATGEHDDRYLDEEMAAISDDQLEELKELEAQGVQNILTDRYLRKLHARMDENHDGKVTAEEAQQFADRVFADMGVPADVADILAEIDSSGDGKVSLEEHFADAKRQAADPSGAKGQTWDPKLEERTFRLADADGDHLLDSSELKALISPRLDSEVMRVEMEALIHSMDTNGDGKLSKDEWISHELADREEAYEAAADARTKAEMDDAFGRLDQNRDSFLDPGELAVWEMGKYQFDRHLAEIIGVADVDRDGQLGLEELVKARDKIAALQDSGRIPDLVYMIDYRDL